MKDLKILLPILLFIIWGIVSCTKDDEIQIVTANKMTFTTYTQDLVIPKFEWISGSRTGFRAETFDRNRYVNENTLLAADTGWFHKQIAFNKDTILNVSYKRSRPDVANINSVVNGVYNITLKFKDGSVVTFNDTYTQNGTDSWTETPTGINLVPDVGNYIKLVRQYVYMLYYDTDFKKYKNKFQYNISLYPSLITTGTSSYQDFLPSKLSNSSIYRL